MGKKVLAFWVIILIAFLSLFLIMWCAKTGSLGFEKLPDLTELENPKSNLASKIITADGQLIGKYFHQNRTIVSYDDLSTHLVDALIATEDTRYQSHSGIDLRGLIRAVAYFGRAGGASTITQQLAKMMFNIPAKSKVQRIKQKLQEWILAVELEKRYTKNEIISMYLNQLDFLNNAVGIQSASHVYFNKQPHELEIQEAAMLVGMAKNPSLYNPIRRPELTMHRREVVLSQMKKANHIDQLLYDSLRIKSLGLDYKVVDHKEGTAPYFRETLRLRLQKLLKSKDEKGAFIYTKKDGTPYNIYRDGLKIYTTLDSRMQEHAEWAVQEYIVKTLQPQFNKHLKRYRKGKYPFDSKITKSNVKAIMKNARRSTSLYRVLTGKECANCGRRGKNVKRIDNYYLCQAEDCNHKSYATNPDSIPIIFDTKKKMKVFSYKGEIDTLMSPNDSIKYYKTFLHTGLMSVDPHTGYIKAWVGGVNYQNFAYDHVTSKRQVGSTFKPFVYTTAIQNGYSPCTEIGDNSYTFQEGDYGILEPWTPKNSDGYFTGCDVSLKYALANSMNSITAYLMKQFGPSEVVALAKKMGITSRLDPVPALCLGVADISVFEMVGANATFVNKGVWIEPTMYTRVEDKNGNVIIDVNPKTSEAMGEETAYVMLDLMKGVTDGVLNRCVGDYRVALGKDAYYNIGTGVRLKGTVSEVRPYVGHHYPIAGKTGTTQNNSDGWFMGLTPDLVTGVWVGSDERSVRFATTAMGQGANTALPVWGYYMQKIHEDKTLNISTEDFQKPEKPLSVELDCIKYKLGQESDDHW